jgi:hypothetical protein
MSYPVDKKQYLQMMRRFVQCELDAMTFVKQFLHARDKDKAKEWAITATWDKPYDQLLIADLRQGKISQEEFSRGWDELFGWSPEEKVCLQLLDRVYSACDAFIDDPALSMDPAHEYDAQQLREMVAKELQAYERFSEGSPEA